MIKHEENQSRAIRLYFFWEKIAPAQPEKGKTYDRKSYQSNFNCSLCIYQLHPWSTGRASSPDGSLQHPRLRNRSHGIYIPLRGY